MSWCYYLTHMLIDTEKETCLDYLVVLAELDLNQVWALGI